MRELKGDLFDPSTYQPRYHGHGFTPDAICISVNGFVKKNGEAVMGRGCAKKAAELMPGLPEILGNHLRHFSPRVLNHGSWDGVGIITFPVKPVSELCKADRSNVVKHMKDRFLPGQTVPGWACVARLDIILRSAKELLEHVNGSNYQYVVLPRVGAGAGELNWNDVKPELDKILDDRFFAITF